YKKHDATVGSLYAPSQVELFSLARFALLKALRGLNWQPGEKVLVPEYICRDLLAPLNIMKADIIFYEVSENMEPVQAPRDWPVARAVIAVNYFGLPQNLAPFFEYKKRTGAILIEDN